MRFEFGRTKAWIEAHTSITGSSDACYHCHSNSNIYLIQDLIQVCYTPLQPQRQWSDWHWSYSSGQITETKQVTGRIEVSYKLSALLSHSLLEFILEYTYSLSQPWMEYNWRFWSCCTCRYSESEPELENTEVRNHPGLTQTISFTASPINVKPCTFLHSLERNTIEVFGASALAVALMVNQSLKTLRWGTVELKIKSNHISTCGSQMWWTCSVAMATTRWID